MVRRWIGWAVGGAIVAVVAFAPFRDTGGSVDTQGRTGFAPEAGAEPGEGDGALDGDAALEGGTGTAGAGSTAGADRGSGGGGTASAGGPSSASPAPSAPDLPEPTERELAVLGPLIAAMDTGQRAGTPLVLGIATSIVASGLPADQDLPPELRPVLSVLAELIATPGAQVNDLTAQGSVHLAQLDRALGELAFLNPALNAAVHETAAQLAALGRAAEPVSGPGAVSLADLSILLTYFVVD